MLKAASPDAKAGDLVSVYDKEGRHFGTGLYNPRARVPLRVIHHGTHAVDETHLDTLLLNAIQWRQFLRLDKETDAYRVVHSDGDGISGLHVDRYANYLSVTVHSLAIYQRLERFLPMLHQHLGTRGHVVHVDPEIARIEGIRLQPDLHPQSPSHRFVKIREHGVRYEVDFETGHKTGFFCDQRENRRKLAEWVHGAKVLDLCCYTGGFAVSAATIGQAVEVTGVDLDENAIATARRNANLNQVRVHWIHCDAFTYSRQMQRNREQFDVVILDPPKFIASREEKEAGQKKYHDLNSLAVSLLRPNGIFVTCSCSGLWPLKDFEQTVIKAAHRVGRKLQFVDQTSAGPDHPVLSNALESRYLKVLWARVR